MTSREVGFIMRAVGQNPSEAEIQVILAIVVAGMVMMMVAMMMVMMVAMMMVMIVVAVMIMVAVMMVVSTKGGLKLLQDMVIAVDKDGTGCIDFPEFLMMMALKVMMVMVIMVMVLRMVKRVMALKVMKQSRTPQR